MFRSYGCTLGKHQTEDRLYIKDRRDKVGFEERWDAMERGICEPDRSRKTWNSSREGGHVTGRPYTAKYRAQGVV